MNVLVRDIIDHGLNNKILRSDQVKRLLEGSDQRRYGLVNRALKSGDLVRLQRGYYILADRYRTVRAHPFAVAQAIVPGSYVSFETALAYHGWIPEAVYVTKCVLPGRKSVFFSHEKLGNYQFFPLALEKGCFLELVDRFQEDEQAMLVAKPLRALLDIVSYKKLEWSGVNYFTGDLRIDREMLTAITVDDIAILQQVYKHKRVRVYLSALKKELGFD